MELFPVGTLHHVGATRALLLSGRDRTGPIHPTASPLDQWGIRWLPLARPSESRSDLEVGALVVLEAISVCDDVHATVHVLDLGSEPDNVRGCKCLLCLLMKGFA